MKIPGRQNKRYLKQTLDSISRNDTNTINVVLNSFSLSDDKVASLAMSLVNNTCVKNLYLHNNGINAKGAALLGFALRTNTTLESVSLNDNCIGNEGCAAISAALYDNTSLITLSLSNNGISNSGGKKLSTMLKESKHSSSINFVFLDGNDISEKIIEKIDKYRSRRKNIAAKANDLKSSNGSHSYCSKSSTGSGLSEYYDELNDEIELNHELQTSANGAGGDKLNFEYGVWKETIGYESLNNLNASRNSLNNSFSACDTGLNASHRNSLNNSFNASDLASYIKKVQFSIKNQGFDCSFVSSNADLSIADDDEQVEDGKERTKRNLKIKTLSWRLWSNRKIGIEN
jgi:hypothetical protein